MSDNAIAMRGLGKRYRLFRSQGWRVAEALGLPVPNNVSSDFWALKDIDLVVRRGERVGLIGRNGAGKSTLLKIVAGLVRPTCGEFRANGRVTALMELGTGFHPDLTGLQNVRAALAYLGVTGAAAQVKTREVLEFAELGEFIEQPFRTYSSGMQARLAFTVATTIEPEILIVDEILGAGDAYFSLKAVARMRALTDNGITLLFVSHDLASVQMMCDRAIWIDRGRIVDEGDTLSVCKAYVAATRKQENIRLQASETGFGHGIPQSDGEFITLTGRLVTGSPSPPKGRHPIRSLRLLHNDEERASVRLGDARDNDPEEDLHAIAVSGYTNWSASQSSNDSPSWREFRDEGGAYHHAPFAIRLPKLLNNYRALAVEIEHGATIDDQVRIEFSTGESYFCAGVLAPTEAGNWRVETFHLPEQLAEVFGPPHAPSTHPEDNLVEGDAYGEGAVQIGSVRFFAPDDATKSEQRVVVCGEPLSIEVQWTAEERIVHCRLVVAIYTMDGRCAAQLISPVSSRDRGPHLDRVDLKPVRLGPKDYIISVGIFRNLQNEHRNGTEPLHVLDRRFRLKVVQPPDFFTETGDYLHEANWRRLS